MQYSIVNLSKAKKRYDFRLEAEFYLPKYLEVSKKIKSCGSLILEDNVIKITDGTHQTPNYKEKGIPFLSALNVKENILDFQCGYNFISEEEHKILYKRCNPQPNDILLRKVGVGLRYATVIPENTPEFSLFVSVALIKTKSFNPYYLSTFINSYYGQIQLLRFNKGISQPDLHLEDIGKLEVFNASSNFQQKIADLVNTSYSLRQSADALYKQAEDELLQELGLKNYVPANKKCFVKNLSEVEVAARFDAEYFQPKYEAVIEKIRSYKGGCFCFEDKDIKDKNFAPVDDVEYKYIELANINSNSSIDNVNTIAGSELPTRARRQVKENDLIVSSVEGSLSSIALIVKKFDDALCSTGFYVVNCDKISSESLLVFLKSEVGQMQLKKGCSGTILSAISKDEFKKVLIPNLSQSIQQSISSKIQQSFANREKSLQLLELAKKSVEVAIEEGEDEAMKLQS